MAEVFKTKSASRNVECSEWTTVILKTGTKRKLSKIEVENNCVNYNETRFVGMRLLSKDAYVGNPFEV